MISGGAAGQAHEDRVGEFAYWGGAIQAVANTGGISLEVPSLRCFVGEKPELVFDAETSPGQKDRVSPLSLGQGQGCL